MGPTPCLGRTIEANLVEVWVSQPRSGAHERELSPLLVCHATVSVREVHLLTPLPLLSRTEEQVVPPPYQLQYLGE